MNLRQTRTFVRLAVHPKTYNEIAKKLKSAGYDHAFIEDDGKVLIDMQGIALESIGSEPEPVSRLITNADQTGE